MIDQRINCPLIAEKKYPHQLEMERAYLIPQLLDPKQLQDSGVQYCQTSHEGEPTWVSKHDFILESLLIGMLS